MSKPTTPDSRYYELVGMVAASWAMLDLNLDLMITMLTSMDVDETACITSQFNSPYPKVKAIIALCEHKGLSDETLKDLKKFAGLHDLAERRNRAIHDAWMEKDGDIVGRFNLKTLRPHDDSDPAEELKSLLEAINRRVKRFGALRVRISNELQSLP